MMPTPQPLIHMAIVHQSVDEYLLSTYCVPSPVMGTGDAAGDRVNMILALYSGAGDRPLLNNHLSKCKNMAIMRAGRRGP